MYYVYYVYMGQVPEIKLMLVMMMLAKRVSVAAILGDILQNI